MADLHALLSELHVPSTQIESSLIKPEDMRALQTGGFVSESEDDLSDSHSVSSVSVDARLSSARSPGRAGVDSAFRDLTARLAEAQSQRADLEERLEAQKQIYKREFAAAIEVRDQELDTLRRTVKRLQVDAPVLRDRIDQLKGDLRDLTISEEYSIELKRTPEADRSFRDWLLVRIYDIVEKYKSSYDREHHEKETFKEELTHLQDKLARTERELSHRTSTAKSQIEDLERHRGEMGLENQKAHKKVEELMNMVRENRDKVVRFDELTADLKKTQSEKLRLENQVEGQTRQIDMLAREKEENLSLLDSKSREMDLLLSDKGYLSKQNSQLLDKVQRLEDRNDRLELEIVEAKNAAQNYLSKLLDMRSDKTVSFEEKLTKELNEIRERHSREMEEMRRQLIEVHEKKVEYMREARETAEFRLQKSEETLKETKKMLEDLQIEHRLTGSKADEELSRLRSELRIKSEQLQLLQNSYEQSLQSLRHSKAENEMLKEKVDLLRQEYYKAEHKCTTENADVKAQYAVAQAQLQQYAMIEQELDYAIENQGIEVAAPTTSKRRVQQSLALAKKLTEKQKEAESLKSEVLHLTSELQRLEEENALNKSLLSQSSQPYSYLVKQLESREREFNEAKKQLQSLSRQNADIVVQYELLERANAEMSRDLKELLSKKQSIEQLHGVLQQLVEQKAAGQEMDGAEVLARLTASAAATQKQQRTPGDSSAPGWFKTLKKKLK